MDKVPNYTARIYPGISDMGFGTPVVLLVDEDGMPKARLMGIKNAQLTTGQGTFAEASIVLSLFEWESFAVIEGREPRLDADVSELKAALGLQEEPETGSDDLWQQLKGVKSISFTMANEIEGIVNETVTGQEDDGDE